MSIQTETPVQASVLTPEDHEFFLANGYIVVKNVVSPETIAATLAVLEDGEGAADQETRAARIADCMTPTVFAAIGELFGPAYPFEHTREAHDMARRYEPGAAWTVQGTHTDEDYATVMPSGSAVFTFVFLTPVQSHGGAFLFAAGSPYRYRPGLVDNLEWTNYLGWTAQPELSGPIQEHLAEPGDLLIYHHNLGHTGSNNVSDPRTRHALRTGFHPLRRIVPGDKPFAEMSTIEKANSARYLQERYGPPHRLPDLELTPHADQVLREGFGVAGGLTTHTVIRFEGVTHLFYVDGADGTAIHHARSTNWVDWTADEDLPAPGGSIRSLHVIHDAKDVVLLAGIEDDGACTHLLTSRDLRDWSPVAGLPDSRGGAGHYSVVYTPSSYEIRNVVVSASPAEPAVVEARWGRSWSEAATWPVTRIGGAAPASEVRDPFVKVVRTGNEFALVADVRAPGEAGEWRPYVTRSTKNEEFEQPLQPLDFAGSTPPRNIRVYGRARDFWLVTYQRAVGGAERLFWGVVDWDTPSPALREVASAAALDEAFQVLGLV